MDVALFIMARVKVEVKDNKPKKTPRISLKTMHAIPYLTKPQVRKYSRNLLEDSCNIIIDLTLMSSTVKKKRALFNIFVH